MQKPDEKLQPKQMLNKCKYFGNYFGVKSFLITFVPDFRIIFLMKI